MPILIATCSTQVQPKVVAPWATSCIQDMDVFRPPSVFRDGSCFANDNRGALSTPHTFSFHPSHPFCLFVNDCASLLEQLHLSIASVAWWSFHRKADADSPSTGAYAERSGMDS